MKRVCIALIVLLVPVMMVSGLIAPPWHTGADSAPVAPAEAEPAPSVFARGTLAPVPALEYSIDWIVVLGESTGEAVSERVLHVACTHAFSSVAVEKRFASSKVASGEGSPFRLSGSELDPTVARAQAAQLLGLTDPELIASMLAEASPVFRVELAIAPQDGLDWEDVRTADQLRVTAELQ